MTKRGKTPTSGEALKLEIDPEKMPKVTGTKSHALQLHLINQVMESLWLPAGLPKDRLLAATKGALAALDGIRPSDEVEGMLATQMVATHSAAMECLRRAMLQDQTIAGRDSNLKHAVKLLSLYSRQVETLDKHRGKGQQKITVEHVNVHAGGQAIVGNVAAPAKEGPASEPVPALENNPDPVMPAVDLSEMAKQRAPQKARSKRGK